MAKLSKDRLIFGVPLIIVVALGMIILGKLGFPNDTWPAFMVMIFFFEAHMDIKKAPHILVGGLFASQYNPYQDISGSCGCLYGTGTSDVGVCCRFCVPDCSLGK